MNKNLFKTILKNYPLGELKSFSLIPVGVSSQNYKLRTTSGTFFLKKHRRSAVKRVHYIEKMERFFSSNGIPVVCPMRTNKGKFHCIHDKDCYVIYPFVSGRIFKAGIMPKDILEKMGAMLGQMHLLTKQGIKGDCGDVSQYFVPQEYAKQTEEVEKFLKVLSTIKRKTRYDNMVYKGLLLKKEIIMENKKAMKNLSFKNLNLGHGDYHPGNIFFDKNRLVSHIFDLDMAGPMPRICEVVRSMMLSCFEHVYTKKRVLQAKIFLASYYRLYPFSKTDLVKALDAFYFKTFSPWRARAHYIEKDFRTDPEYAGTIRTIRYLRKYRGNLAKELYRYINR